MLQHIMDLNSIGFLIANYSELNQYEIVNLEFCTVNKEVYFINKGG